ncbi:MAG: isopentenyl-diphosphate Delta-isomerase [bacterium]|nr:MAG: isopentenyl-diphosphate Delta-isomerase [bacterium]
MRLTFSRQDNKVSFDNELLILVNESDKEIGHKNKLACHQGNGILHRAFSIFIFNDAGKVLMQKRSSEKKLWPLFWSNSCCSHPRKGEKIEKATHRRMEEELGFRTDLQFIFKFQYQANYLDIGSENELCSVYIGKSIAVVRPNKNEIEEWQYLSVQELDQKIEDDPTQFTPWFKIEWQRMRTEFWPAIQTYLE